MRTDAGPRHQVVLVRDWHDHHGAGGCCGSTEAIAGLVAARGDGEACEPDSGARAADRTGLLYRRLRSRVPHVGLVVVDSRNWLWLVPSTYRALRARGAGRGHAVRAAASATTPGAVLVDGQRLVVGQEEPVDVVVDRVLLELQEPTGTLAG